MCSLLKTKDPGAGYDSRVSELGNLGVGVGVIGWELGWMLLLLRANRSWRPTGVRGMKLTILGIVVLVCGVWTLYGTLAGGKACSRGVNRCRPAYVRMGVGM